MTNSELQNQWGARLQELRIERGLSVRALAQKAGVDPGHLSKFENGLAGIADEGRLRIASAIGVRVEDIWAYPEQEAS